MMELQKNHDQEQKPVSVLQGDRFCISRILARESSIGQSSRIFYRSAEGIPFKWEMQPGTPKNPQEEDAIPPLSPSPLMQSLGLPLPNVEDYEEPEVSAFKKSKFWSFKKMVKKSIILDMIKKVEIQGMRRSKQQENSRFGDSVGELMASVENSSFSSNSPSSSFSLNSRGVDLSRIDGPFCCSPWNVPALLEGNTRIHYCSQHKTAFAVEQDGSILSRILPGVSAADQFSGPLHNEITPAGIPFRWEMQPGTPKRPPENELIPPPSPPPAAQSLALPPPRLHSGGENAKDSTWRRAWYWTRLNHKKKETEKMQHEISFRYNEKVEVCSSDEEFDAPFCKSVSVSSSSLASPLSKGAWRVSKIKRSFRGSYFSCGPWSGRGILVSARTKLKIFAS